MAKIVILSGNPTKTSRLDTILGVVEKQLREANLEIEWIRVRDLPAEDLLHARFDSEAIIRANALIEQADGVVIATPVYKASYTGILKAYLDLLPQKGLDGKLVLPLAIGGTIAHLLAIDYALKPLLAALGVRHVLAGAFVQDTQVKKNEDGTGEIEAEAARRLHESTEQFVHELYWHVKKKQSNQEEQIVK
ncbi:NADPH-dependent FMN reductase [Brevibacillus reuszeri]|uniref:NADPH-dependent FMN reductase n=1 Tax=Brevibacillus reuszeri TaxID=54915 RepID=UPI0028A23A84|nr:NADPH-dependent FMN reductase [Brevibacillus reuszeri]